MTVANDAAEAYRVSGIRNGQWVGFRRGYTAGAAAERAAIVADGERIMMQYTSGTVEWAAETLGLFIDRIMAGKHHEH